MSKLFETVDFLYDNFEKINTKDEFEGIASKVWKKKTGEKLTLRKTKNICFGLWNKIYDIEISNKKELEKAERLFTKFLKITDYEWFFFEWNDAKYSTLANLILNKKPSKKFNIRNSEDLSNLRFYFFRVLFFFNYLLLFFFLIWKWNSIWFFFCFSSWWRLF